MLGQILDNIILFVGAFIVVYSLYNIICGRGRSNNFLWLLAGLMTVIVIVLQHTIFIDLSLAGHERAVFYLKNLADGIVFMLWLYVAYKYDFFKNITR